MPIDLIVFSVFIWFIGWFIANCIILSDYHTSRKYQWPFEYTPFSCLWRTLLWPLVILSILGQGLWEMLLWTIEAYRLILRHSPKTKPYLPRYNK